MKDLKLFRFWVQSVLPVVYDDSLSYYEVLCKCVDYINKLIETDKEIFDDIDALKTEIKEVEERLDNFGEDFAEKAITDAIATMVFFGLTDSGYFVAYIPKSWSDVHFCTTVYDIDVPSEPEYGHLCLRY